MRSGLLFLPFLAMFSAIIALATQKALKEMPIVGIIFWAMAAVSFVLWVVLDFSGFKAMFRRKRAGHVMSQGLSVVLAIALAIGIGFISKRDRFNKSYDLTTAQVNTLSPESIKLVEQLNTDPRPIEVLAFFQDETKKLQFAKLLGLYQFAGAAFNVEYIDPQTDPTRAMGENVTVPDTVIFKRGRQESRLTTYNEEKFSNALVRVAKEKERTVYFLSGHGEPDLENQDNSGYHLAKTELESERFIVKKINLLEVGKIPEDADLLVIAGPKYDLKPNEKALIESYMKDARPLMMLIDAMVDLPLMNELVALTGLRLNNDLLVIRPEDPRVQLLGQNNAIITELDAFSPITADFAKRGGVSFVTGNTRSVEIDGANPWQLKPVLLAKTSSAIVRIIDVTSPEDLKGGVVQGDRIKEGNFDVFAVASGKIGGDKIAAVESKDKQDLNPSAAKMAKELRVFIGGTAQLASNIGAQRGENLDLFINAVNYLLQDEDFLSIRAKTMDPSRLELTTQASLFLLLFISYVYPTLFLGAGAFYWMQRRRA